MSRLAVRAGDSRLEGTARSFGPAASTTQPAEDDESSGGSTPPLSDSAYRAVMQALRRRGAALPRTAAKDSSERELIW